MNKRKILTLAMALCMAAILVVGGTMAYFTDTEAKANVFTVGNVDIELIENFNPDNDPLRPATGSAQDGSLQNGITKEVTVKNTGSEDAYVRVHIAIPQILDDGAETFDASANLLHFNFENTSVGAGKWDWSKTTGTPYTGDWNYYVETVEGVVYNVYVVTYESVLAAGTETPEKAIHQVYLDSAVTNEDVLRVKETLGDDWKILVVAEGVQSEGFANAYEALNTAFGVPGAYDVAWPTAD